MRLKLLGALVFGLLTASLLVGTVFAGSATQSYTGPEVEIDGAIMATPVAFTEGVDFHAGSSITDVDITIYWTKTAGSCSAPSADSSAFYDELGFQLQSPSGTTITLVATGTYGSDADIDGIITTFDDGADGRPAGGTPVSGTFRPTGSPLSTFNGEDPLGDWYLISTDEWSGDSLCLSQFDLTVNADPPPDADPVTDVVLTVDIDIKPGSESNAINRKGKGVIPVAILGSETFDVADIDMTTLTFGPHGASPAHNSGGHIEDVNEDGIDDLVSHYRTQDTGIMGGDVEACVSGQTLSGTPFEGCDSVLPIH